MWKYIVEPGSPQMMGTRLYAGKLRPKNKLGICNPNYVSTATPVVHKLLIVTLVHTLPVLIGIWIIITKLKDYGRNYVKRFQNAGGKIEKNEMGGACGTYGGGERCAQGFGRQA